MKGQDADEGSHFPADFHGHLCPDLAIGYRASQTALARLTLERMYWQNLRVIVENTTSAVDAIQLLTGCTLGNCRLRLHDWGKHVYTFIYGDGEGLRLSLRSEAIPENSQLLALEGRIQTERATMSETVHYQALLDERIAALIAAPADALFFSQRVAVEWPDEPVTSALAPCDGCGDVAFKTHLTLRDGKRLCRLCADSPNDRPDGAGRTIN